MLDLAHRIEVIEKLLEEPSQQKLTYAAIECRLTIEYLCYQRFKLVNPFLGEKDLIKWSPANVIRQVSEEINENINQELKIAISPDTPNCDGEATTADYEALEYTELGVQSALKIRTINKLWNSLSNVALHIPVPTIAKDELNIYGDSEIIEKQVNTCIEYFKSLKGNLIIGGPIGEIACFHCQACDTEIRRPAKSLDDPIHVHCINPQCNESYQLASDGEGGFDFTRQTIDFKCTGCNDDLKIPLTHFSTLTIDRVLPVICSSCNGKTEIIMQPMSRYNQEENL